MNNIVIITGSPGVGKSTMIRSIAEGGKYNIINVGTFMLEIAMKEGIVKDRDELRFLNKDVVRKLQDRTFTDIAKMEGKIILDTHASVESNGRFVPGVPFDTMSIIRNNIHGIIYIDALTEEIMKRARGDTKRTRNTDEAFIDAQRGINLSILSMYSTYLNIPLYVIFNRQDRLDEGVKSLKEHLEQIFSE
ncbi:MAG TPA: AAA family ATPase [Candidatus Baltobacteraceae bacterium]|nr:AAA family ATPase [Candidatus Baltobacteraceae bacterium]